MKVFVILLAIACLASFSWGRSSFFRRTKETKKGRGGLGPLGVVFGLSVIAIFVLLDPPAFGLALSIAVLLLVSASCVFWWAVYSFKDDRPDIAFTSASPVKLVCDGAYRWVRHPFYCSYMLFWLSGFAYSLNPIALIFPVVMGGIYFRAAFDEEARIRSSPLGEQYSDYSRRVGMFFPKFI